MDTISSDAIRAFCIGVTNAIFRQRRDLADVTVTVGSRPNEFTLSIV